MVQSSNQTKQPIISILSRVVILDSIHGEIICHLKEHTRIQGKVGMGSILEETFMKGIEILGEEYPD